MGPDRRGVCCDAFHARYKESISRRATRRGRRVFYAPGKVKGVEGSITGSLSSWRAHAAPISCGQLGRLKRTTRTARTFRCLCVPRGDPELAGVPASSVTLRALQISAQKIRSPFKEPSLALGTFFPRVCINKRARGFSFRARLDGWTSVSFSVARRNSGTRSRKTRPCDIDTRKNRRKRERAAEMKGQRSRARLLALNGSIYSAQQIVMICAFFRGIAFDFCVRRPLPLRLCWAIVKPSIFMRATGEHDDSACGARRLVKQRSPVGICSLTSISNASPGTRRTADRDDIDDSATRTQKSLKVVNY